MKKSSRSFLVGLVIFGVVASASLAYFVLPTRAADLASVKDTIGNSQPGVASSHSFVFTPATTTAIKTVTFQYCTTASGTCTAPTGMVLTAAPQLGTVSGISGTGYTSSATNTNCTGTGNTNCTITLTVTTPASQALAPANVPFLSGITNPTTANTTTFVRITTQDTTPTTIDAATVAFATLTGTSLSMTASVDPTFTFTVAAVAAGTVNGATINVTTGTGATVIPFGGVNPGTPKIAAHDVSVTTNALNGYLVTASSSASFPLQDGSNHFNSFSGTNTTPTVWSAPAGVTANTNTGYVGYTTEETTLTGGTGNRFSSNKWAGLTNNPDPVISSSAGTGASARTIRVGWEADANALQPPSPNYTGTVILVATPTY